MIFNIKVFISKLYFTFIITTFNSKPSQYKKDTTESGSQSMVTKPAASASGGNLLETQIF